MSKGDSILLQTVLEAGGSSYAAAAPTCLSDLNADQIIQSVIGCLEVIFQNQGKTLDNKEESDGSQLSSRYTS